MRSEVCCLVLGQQQQQSDPRRCLIPLNFSWLGPKQTHISVSENQTRSITCWVYVLFIISVDTFVPERLQTVLDADNVGNDWFT